MHRGTWAFIWFMAVIGVWGKLANIDNGARGLAVIFVILLFIGLYFAANYTDKIIELIVRNKEATDREISKLEETIRKLKHKKVVV